MNTYEIQGFNKYKGVQEEIIASNPKQALTILLKDKHISFVKIEKMTSKVIGELLDKGYTNLEITEFVDFTINKKDDYSSSANGSYRIY